MLGENKNLKDQEAGEAISLMDRRFFLSYRKTNKLITALYMVTDVLEETEPIRHKLRTLGIDIISDITAISSTGHVLNNTLYTDISTRIDRKANEMLSLLEIAAALRMISEMNFGILKKEFINLAQSAREGKKDLSILELLENEDKLDSDMLRTSQMPGSTFPGANIGQVSTRIGVQRGSTLLRALNNVHVPNKVNRSPLEKNIRAKNDFNFLKDKRREEILSVLKDMKSKNLNFQGLTITDIKNASRGELANCGEKTLQRELVAMTTLGLISKTGSKRWSRYSPN